MNFSSIFHYERKLLSFLWLKVLAQKAKNLKIIYFTNVSFILGIFLFIIEIKGKRFNKKSTFWIKMKWIPTLEQIRKFASKGLEHFYQSFLIF
jgi:hypothetical protein